MANCILCRLLAAVRPGSSGFYGLYAFGGKGCKIKPYKYYGDGPKSGLEDSVCMALISARSPVKAGKQMRLPGLGEIYKSIRETGFISLQILSDDTSPGRFRGRCLDDKLANFDLVIHWLKLCVTHHKGRCNIKPCQPFPSLNVIDCENRRVIPAGDGCPYLALSYVWGPDSSMAQHVGNGSHLLDLIPQVIEDALTVTLRLKYRYIWIDRYCIPQDDDSEKRAQIKHMGSIYTNAEATVVAAAGANSSCSLPGAGYGNRRSQPQARIGNVQLCSTMPDSKLSISKSKWMTRAWAYQEGLLSRRLIIFTEDQVYFQCHDMHCYEAIVSPLAVPHTKSDRGFRPASNCHLFPSPGVGFDTFKFVEVAKAYSARDLTYDRDILDGVLGILRLLETSEFSI